MKLRLPLFLLSGILSLPVTMPAAATVIGTGVSYDVGKGSYSQDETAWDMGTYDGGTTPRTDTLLCWACSASNLIQYWQDNYYTGNAASGTPQGLNPTTYTSPEGTRNLNVYEKFLSSSTVDDGGFAPRAFDWWFKDVTPEGLDSSPKNYYTVFNEQDSAAGEGADFLWQYIYLEPAPTTMELKENLDAIFANQGQAVALKIWQIDGNAPLKSRYHAISCWGYESNETGVTALYLTDSDDLEYGVFRVSVTEGQVKDIMGASDTGYLDALVLSTDEQLDGYDKRFQVALMNTDYIATPGKISQSRQSATGQVSEGETITSNKVLEGTNTVIAEGIVVGDGKAIAILTANDSNTTLSLDGTTAGESSTGLTVKEGSLASLYNFSAQNYDNGAIKNEGRVSLHEGSVDISSNTAERGAAINNANFVSIEGNETVVMTNNSSTQEGGAIYNTSEISIRGNKSVVFSENTAAKGNDIYNASGATVNIADNGNVQFNGSDPNKAAVVNNGSLYLQSGVSTGEEGPETGLISFTDSALDSNGGKTYVGQDVNGKTADTVLSFSAGEKTLSMTTSGGVVTELEHLKVNATEIVGVAPGESYVKNATVTTLGVLHLSGLTLDSTSTFGERDTEVSPMASVNMDNVVITLTSADMTQTGYGYSVDLSDMFNYLNMNLDTVYFDASSVLVDGLDEGKYINVNFGLGDDVKAKAEKVAVMFGNGMMTNEYTTLNGGNVQFRGMVVVPEPTTGTLSLLALAGLAARRRRK